MTTFREVQGRRKDGTTFPLEIGIRKLVQEDGVHYIGCLRDITERKRLQNQLVQAQKLESIGQLAAGIAHEINTPVQFVGDNLCFLEEVFAEVSQILDAWAKVVQRTPAGMDDADLVTLAWAATKEADLEYLREEVPLAIRQGLEGVSRIAHIVSAMKEFSHPGRAEKQDIDLNRAIESTVVVSRNEWRYVAAVEMDLDPGLPPVPCLAAEINQVLLNVIVNAAHAIEAANEGEAKPEGRIVVVTRREGAEAEVRISDTGVGIPEEILPKIFDPFFTTKEVGRGTGQGLAIAHDVVREKHGGSIRVESEVGRGSTFTIRLPLSPVAGDVEAECLDGVQSRAA